MHSLDDGPNLLYYVVQEETRAGGKFSRWGEELDHLVTEAPHDTHLFPSIYKKIVDLDFYFASSRTDYILEIKSFSYIPPIGDKTVFSQDS